MTTNGKETEKLGEALAAKNGAQAKAGDVAMEELLYHVKSTIDLEGRYLDRLKLVSVGFAAGRGISPVEARAQIEQGFNEKFGQTPHEYLDHHFHAARGNGHGRDQSRQPSYGMGR